MAVYDIDLQYHLGKVSMVPDALSKKSETMLIVQLTQKKKLLKEIERMDFMTIRRISTPGQLTAF